MIGDRLEQRRAAVAEARRILDPDVPTDAAWLAELEAALKFHEQAALRDFAPRGKGN